MIIYHADDYGISLNASKEILALIKKGCLDSISIIPNMSCYESCMNILLEDYDTFKDHVDIALHLNLFEGHCVANKQDVSLLVDEKGFFVPSWIWFFKSSYLPGRKLLQEQLEVELYAQIQKLTDSMPKDYVLCVDSHQHSHMIPVVWDALRAVIKKHQIPVKYVRISREPLIPYLSTFKLYPSYSVTNIIKNEIIQICTLHANLHPITKAQKGYTMWGLIMGGQMDQKRIETLMPKFEKFGAKDKLLELLFHPGTMLASELSSEYNKQEFVDAETSPNRKMEYQSLEAIRA